VFIVEQARQPQAYHEDRRLTSAEGSENIFLFGSGGKKDPDRDPSVWEANPTGALVVTAGGVLRGSGDTENVLFAVARLLSTAGA
jgi:hypothetical protein